MQGSPGALKVYLGRCSSVLTKTRIARIQADIVPTGCDGSCKKWYTQISMVLSRTRVRMLAHLEVAGSSIKRLALGQVVDEESAHQGQASTSCLYTSTFCSKVATSPQQVQQVSATIRALRCQVLPVAKGQTAMLNVTYKACPWSEAGLYLVDGANAQHVQHCEDADASQDCYEYLHGSGSLSKQCAVPIRGDSGDAW